MVNAVSLSPSPNVPNLDPATLLYSRAVLDVTKDGNVDRADARALGQSGQRWAAQQAATMGAALAAGAAIPNDGTVHNVLAGLVPELAGSSTPPGVIRAITDIDTERLRQSGVKPIATFDMDGTSIKGDIFLPFVELLATKGRFGAEANKEFQTLLSTRAVDQEVVQHNDGNANALLALSLVNLPETDKTISIADMFFASGRALKGMSLQQAQYSARELINSGTPTQRAYKLNVNDDSPANGDSVPEVMAALKQKGITPWVVTMGFDFLARQAAPLIGVSPNHVLGSHLAVRDGKFTGEMIDPYKFGKGRAIADKIGKVPLVAFGDSGSDATMFDLASVHGIVVNPSQKMKDLNTQRGGDLGYVRYAGTVGDWKPVQS